MTIVPTHFPHGITPHQRFSLRFRSFCKELSQDRQWFEVALKNLERLPPQKQRDEVRKLLSDRRAHRVSAFDTVRRTNGLLDATPETVLALATRANVFRPVKDEPVRIHMVAKGSGKRAVQNYGPHRRMHQTLVARLLRHLHPPLDCQKLFRGGMPKARKAIEGAVRDGHTHGVEVDFVGFYGSVRSEALPDLLRPLPTSVVDGVVWDGQARALRGAPVCSLPDPTSSAYEGLSLGSACSPIVGEAIIARVLAAAQLRDVVTFADNLFVFGRSEEDVQAKLQGLRDTVARQPYGALELRVARADGFDLAYHFEFAKQAGNLRDGMIQWSPGARKLAQFMVGDAAHITFDQLSAAEARVVHWRRAYPDWTDGNAFETEFLAAIAARRYYLNRHPLHLRRALDSVIVAFQERLAIEPHFEGGMLHFIPREGDPLGDGYQRLIDELRQHLDRHERERAA